MKDTFMYTTVEEIAAEYAIYDKEFIEEVYQELYSKTNAVNKSWNCRMIDKIIERKTNKSNSEE